MIAIAPDCVYVRVRRSWRKIPFADLSDELARDLGRAYKLPWTSFADVVAYDRVAVLEHVTEFDPAYGLGSRYEAPHRTLWYRTPKATDRSLAELIEEASQ